jgi:hypothetical protein
MFALKIKTKTNIYQQIACNTQTKQQSAQTKQTQQKEF